MIDADHFDCKHLFDTKISVRSKHTVFEVKYTLLRSVQDENYCVRARNVPFQSVFCSHPATASTFALGITILLSQPDVHRLHVRITSNAPITFCIGQPS